LSRQRESRARASHRRFLKRNRSAVNLGQIANDSETEAGALRRLVRSNASPHDGVALVGIVLGGTLSGSMLPLILREAGFDPAASSAPFVAALADVTGLVIYFSVTAIVLRGALL